MLFEIQIKKKIIRSLQQLCDLYFRLSRLLMRFKFSGDIILCMFNNTIAEFTIQTTENHPLTAEIEIIINVKLN